MRMNLMKLSTISVLVLVLAFEASAQQRPCVTASKFGADDQIGNMNYVTPAKTLAATKLVTKGKSYRLGIEITKTHPPIRRAPSR